MVYLLLQQNSYNAYLMAGLGMGGGGTLGMAAAVGASHLTSTATATGVLGIGANTSATTATTTLRGFAVGGAALLGLGTPALLTKHHHQHHQHHRHSLTTRHRVLRTRSSGATHNIWDEQLMEVSAFSFYICIGREYHLSDGFKNVSKINDDHSDWFEIWSTYEGENSGC